MPIIAAIGVIIIVTTKAATPILLVLSLLTSKNRDSAPIAKQSIKIVALILATNLFSFPRTDVRVKKVCAQEP
nr:MAG TPA: hypothetical protein [Caudoviricetes sp.]